MTKANLGLTSASKASTHKQNREKEINQLKIALIDLRKKIKKLTEENIELRGD
jgi:hypothetical protein